MENADAHCENEREEHTGRKRRRGSRKEMFSYLYDDEAEAFTGRCKEPSPLLEKQSQIDKELKHSSPSYSAHTAIL